MMRYLPVLFVAAAAPAWAQATGSYYERARTCFYKISAATTAHPSAVVTANLSQCPISNGDIVYVDQVRGATNLNIHLEDANDANNMARIIQNIGIAGANTFTLTDLAGNPISGATGASCGGPAASITHNCAYSGGGRMGKVAAKSVVSNRPIGLSAAKLASLLIGPKAHSNNPAYDRLLARAGEYEAAYDSKVGFGWLKSDSGGTGSGAIGGEFMSAASTIKWLLTADAASLALVKWMVDNPDDGFGTPACDETDNSSNCRAPTTPKMDYVGQFRTGKAFAYSAIRAQLTTLQKQKFANFHLNDLSWRQGGVGYTGTNLVKPVYTKAWTTSAGSISWPAAGKSKTITGTGATAFLANCAVGGWINNGSDVDWKIASITDDTHLVVEVSTAAAGSSGTWSCGPAWTAGDYGWLWWMKHYLFSTLTLSGENMPPSIPGGVDPPSSPFYPFSGGGNYGDNNHNYSRTYAMYIFGLALCPDDPRGCLLATQADAYMHDMVLPTAMRIWTGYVSNGSTYWGRMWPPIIGWASARINSVSGGSSPFQGTNWPMPMIEAMLWGVRPKHLMFVPISDYQDYGFVELNNYVNAMGAYGFDPTTATSTNFKDFMTTKTWGLSGQTYVDGNGVVDQNDGTGLVGQYLNWEPAGTSTAITDLTKFFVLGDAETECAARYGASYCTTPDKKDMAVSRTSWDLDDEVYLFYNLGGFSCRDHCGPDRGGYLHLLVNGQMVEGADGPIGSGTRGPMGVPGDLAAIYRSRNYPIVDGSGDDTGRGYVYATPMGWHSGDNNFMHARGDLFNLYKVSQGVTAMERQVFHLKAPGEQSYVIDYVKGAMSSPKTFSWGHHFRLNQNCGANPNAATCITLNNTTKTAVYANPTTGSEARDNVHVFGISGTFNITTQDGNLAHGAYTGGEGYTFRWQVEPAAGTASAPEVVLTHMPCPNTTCTEPPITLSGEDGFHVLDIADPSHPYRLMWTGGGATISSTSFTLDDPRDVLLVGLTAGTKYAKADGVGVCTATVVAGEHSLRCELPAGLIEIDENPPTGGSITITTATPLPAGPTGVAYSQSIAATGGNTPYAWSISAGALPPGLGINPTTGAITGTPTMAGNYTFTVHVEDEDEVTATKEFTLAITTPAVTRRVRFRFSQPGRTVDAVTISYGTAADSLVSSVTNSSCASGCTVEVFFESGETSYFRWQWKLSGAAVGRPSKVRSIVIP